MFKVIAGDFPKNAEFWGDKITWTSPGFWRPRREFVNLKGQIESLEIVTEENKAKFLSAAGWGVVGAALAGPAGLVAGALLGGLGRKKELCVAVQLTDGRKFLALCDPKTYRQLVALHMQR